MSDKTIPCRFCGETAKFDLMFKMEDCACFHGSQILAGLKLQGIKADNINEYFDAAWQARNEKNNPFIVNSPLAD